ncbi:opa3-like protein [Acrodontium crateriforme]|uniref:Opa3-like protein n=1 Tax=Acrodontium crateriforme TaxID=150365 RepID=A0AAQ3M7W2_9PEZI|nr:opa3-like protein [Acrodontium crateriforme]
MSLTFKLLSLVIRTAAKPIGNYIKRQAKEHEGFRRYAIRQAQRVHRVDMRMRLGILHDPVAQERMHERELKAAEDKKRLAETPMVRTEEEQKKWDEEQAKAEKEGSKSKEEKAPRVKIRPLSEAKAIELGANFFSEAFIFAVAAGLLVWDNWRSRRKEGARRDMVAERLDSLEGEVERLRSKYEPELPALIEKTKAERNTTWYNPASWWTRTEPEVQNQPIPGNVPIPKQETSVATSPKSPTETTPAGTKAEKPLENMSPSKEDVPASKPKQPERVDSVTATKKER